MSELEAAEFDDDDDFDDDDSTIVRESTDNVGDVSVELNVEELLHELEMDGIVTTRNGQDIARRRLEELMEQKRAARDLEDFDDYDV